MKIAVINTKMISKILIIFFSLVFATISLIQIDSKRIREIIEWENELQGIKTNITPLTIKYRKFVALLFLTISMVLAFATLVSVMF